MDGVYISAINAAMMEIRELFRVISSEKATHDFLVGAITFSEHAEWVDEKKLLSLEEFQWDDIAAGKTSELGKALELAESVLNEDAAKKLGYSKDVAPIIVYVGDGRPTDRYWETLRKIKQNSMFDHSMKLALTIGEMVDREMLMNFTGNLEALIPLNDIEAIRKFVMR